MHRRTRIEALEDRKLFSVTDLIMDPFNANALSNIRPTDDFSLNVAAAPRALMEEDFSSAHTYGPRGPMPFLLTEFPLSGALKDVLVSSYAAPHAGDGSGQRAAAVDQVMETRSCPMYRSRIENLEDRKLLSATDMIADPSTAAEPAHISVSVSRTESVGKDESLSVGNDRSGYFILPNGELLVASTLGRLGWHGPVTLGGGAAEVSGPRQAAIDRVMVDWGDGQADAILHEDNEFSFPRMLTASRTSANAYNPWITVDVTKTGPGTVLAGFNKDGAVDGNDL